MSTTLRHEDDIDFKMEEKHVETSLEDTKVHPEETSELRLDILQLHQMSAEEYKTVERKLVRKIDMTLMPALFVLLILNYLDRNALSSAKVQGIEKSLGMKGNDFNVAISVLFAGYICGQLPSNLILSKSRPSMYLSTCVFLWAIVSLCTGFVKNFHQLLAVRILLGLTEAPFFPGALFLLSSWYTKEELAFRTAFFYTGSLLSGAFSGFITAGIQAGLNGTLGYESWRWVAFIEGSITAFCAILAFFLLPDYPATTKWLSRQEKAMAVWRLEKDGGSKDEDTTTAWQSVKLALGDYRLYILALLIVTKTTAGAVTQFIPTVVKTFNYNAVDTLLLTSPPYLFAVVTSIIISRSSDKRRERCWHTAIPLAFGMIGYIIAAATTKTAPRYVAIMLMIGGIYGSYNVALAWIASCFPRPRAKRASAYAIINSLGNLAQIWSPYLYDSSYAPYYKVAWITNSIMCAIAVASCYLLRFCLQRDNRKMDQREIDNVEGAESTNQAQKFRYVL